MKKTLKEAGVYMALSVRQPWAWAIIHGGKDIENRSKSAFTYLNRTGRIAIHAAKGMTRDEYEDAAHFMQGVGVNPPLPGELQRAGIIGSVDVVELVKRSQSPWFFGPCGLVLARPAPCDFIPCKGQLGFFRWSEADETILPSPAKWMENYG